FLTFKGSFSLREFIALNVYIALCYYKLDYYDVSLEMLQAYTAQHPDSLIALILRACNHYKLYNGKAAEAEVKVFQDILTPSFTFGADLLKHNLVVYRNGEGARQVLPPLVDVIPEARLNLVIFHLRNDETREAHELISELEPTVPQEYILKGVVCAALGQETGSRELMKQAQQFFQLVGGSSSECDTIPGRQCMASAFFLLKQYDDVLLYLNSIRSYFHNDDIFNYDYGQALAANGKWQQAEEAFLMIQNEKLRNDFHLLSWLARCFIQNGKPHFAWELYMKMDTSQESYNILQIIANDCYKTGQFLISAKAFDILERLDPVPEHWEGKRGAIVGTFQLVIAQKEAPETMLEILQLLRNSNNPQADAIAKVIRDYARSNTSLRSPLIN
ncbi:unnamed protein product, partial [Cyprideis torosa]